jgi:hypothetical protein
MLLPPLDPSGRHRRAANLPPALTVELRGPRLPATSGQSLSLLDGGRPGHGLCRVSLRGSFFPTCVLDDLSPESVVLSKAPLKRRPVVGDELLKFKDTKSEGSGVVHVDD